MAISWGTAQGASGKTKFRVGIELSIPSPGRTDLAVNVTAKIWIWTKDAVNDSSVTLTWSGYASGSDTVSVVTPSNSDWSTKNQKLVKTITTSVATGHVDQQLTISASAKNIEAAGASTIASKSVSGTLKASPVDPPQAPTGCAASWISDSALKITWTNTNPTIATAPYIKLGIERWDNVKNAWYAIATLGVVTTFTDSTVTRDRRYAYRVRAINGDGKSAYSTSGNIETTPATPTGVSVRRPVGNVEVTWTNTSTIATTVEVWHSVDGVMDTSSLATVSASTSSYIHVSPDSTQTHAYYVRALGVRTSPFSAVSPSVPPLAAPLTPSGLEPAGGTLEAGEDITLDWDHNPADGTSQVAFKLRWRVQGDADWITPQGQELSATASTSTSVINCSGHSFNRGDIVRFSGEPPAPLVAGTTYYAAPVTASSFRVGETLEDVEDDLDSTEITLTSAGGTFSVLTGRLLGTSTSYTLPANTLPAGEAIEWSVSTQGRYSSLDPFSPWAPVSGFRTASTPLVTISYPDSGSTVVDPTAMVSWAFYSADSGITQQWAQVSLREDGSTQVLEQYEADGEWFDCSFFTQLDNGETYAIDVLVEGTNGIRSEVTTTVFTAEYVGPDAPGISLDWDDEDGKVIITITNPGGEDAPPAASNEIWRSVGGDAFTKLASGVPINTTWVDYLPVVGAVNTYKIVAIAANKTRTSYQVAAECVNTGDWYWLNGGSGWGTVAKVRYDGGVTIRFSRDKTLQEFAGRTRPVEFTGTMRTHEIDLTAVLPRDEEGYEASQALIDIVDIGGPIFYRDFVGRRMKCSIDGVELSDSDNLIEFRTTLTEVST